MSLPSFSVIIPSYRNVNYLDLCLTSIIHGQVNENEIIVVLDGFLNEYEGIEKRHPKVNFLTLPNNMGMQYAINLGVYNASNKRIFVGNDDNIWPSRWDEKLKPALDGDFANDVITVDQIEPSGPGMFQFHVYDCGLTADTFSFDKFEDACKQVDDAEIPGVSIHHTPDGRIFPFIINKKDFLMVGGFDTFYQSPNIVDWDFFLKLELAKKNFFRIHTAHLYHFGSIATKKNAEADMFRKKEQKAIETFRYKWHIEPYNGIYNTKIPPNSWLSK